MAKFIEIKNVQGYKVLINASSIESIQPVCNKYEEFGNTVIQLPHSKVRTYEVYDEISKLLKM